MVLVLEVQRRDLDVLVAVLVLMVPAATVHVIH